MPTLLIDGDPSVRADIAAALAETCNGFLEAASLADARAILSECRHHGRRLRLIVLDITLPDGDGLELCRSLRRLVELRDVPILITVSAPHEDRIAAAFDAGATDCIAKPIRRSELLARVLAALKLSRVQVQRSTRGRTLRKRTEELLATKERLERLVCVDELSGVANRRQLDVALQSEWNRAARDGLPLAVVIIDIDHFHLYNERYGHPAGDQCLRRVADALAGSLRRPSDFLGRYGGEEFLAILPSTTLDGAGLVAERLRLAVQARALPHEASPCAPVVTVSAGVACTRPVAGALQDLVAKADAALYDGKRDGRNRVGGLANAAGVVAIGRPSAPGGNWPAPELVDPVLAPQVPAFLERKKERLPFLHAALASSDFDRIRFIARELRHGAAQHTLDGLERLGAKLERSARRRHGAVVEAGIAELAWYLDRVQVVYRRRTNPPLDGHK